MSMNKTTKQTVTSDSWDSARGEWVKVTSEIEALPAEAQADLEIQATREFIATCSYDERMEYARDFPEAYNRAFPVTHPPVALIPDWDD